MRAKTPLATRFWPKVDRSGGPLACWPWTAALVVGYGALKEGGRVTYAHRVAWELTHGAPLADTEVIRHTCDNPPCCNPTHLQRGTHADNSRDKLLKGRQPFGERHGMSKLTEAQVVEIRQRRAQGERPSVLARAFGVSDGAIWLICTGARWRSVR